MNKIENLDIGHIKHGLDKKFIVKITDKIEDRLIETDIPHRHNFYMICLVVSGTGSHLIDFERIDIIPNRLFFLKPEQVHFWQLDTGVKLAVVQYSPDFLTELFNPNSLAGINNPSRSYFDLTEEDASSIFRNIEKIHSEYNAGKTNSLHIVQATLFILLTELMRMVESGETKKMPGKKTEIAGNFKKLVDHKFKEVSSVADYARLMNITPNYLNMVVKEVTGLTANEIINKRLLLEAKRMIIDRNKDITQIAFELGFNDPSYFARFFKREEGISPTQFRLDIYKKYQYSHK